MSALERFAPLPLQEGYDNAGLQIGLTEVEATGALLCLDVTEAIVDEAITLGFNLIISHHPLLFKGLKCISNRSYTERCVLKAIKNDITIYAMHTNLDNVIEGVNHEILNRIGMSKFENILVLAPQNGNPEAGSGLIAELKEPEPELQLLKQIKKNFEVECLRHTKLTGRLIHKVAVCGGAGAFLIPDAIKQEADLFITGEIRYHEYFGHEKEILLAEIGHYESEQYTKELIAGLLKETWPELTVVCTKINTNPIKYL